MIQLCMMGGQDGRLQIEGKFYLTLFGACELVRPTLARQIAETRLRRRDGRVSRPNAFFVTLCGVTEIKSPTLAEEYLDLREMVRSGDLGMDDWEHCMADIGTSGLSISSFTLMGAFAQTELPTDNKEIDSLAVQTHLGNISDGASKILQLGIGQDGSERHATLRRAVTTST